MSELVELSENLLSILALLAIAFGFYHRVKRQGEKIEILETRMTKHEDFCLKRAEKVDQKLSDILVAIEVARH